LFVFVFVGRNHVLIAIKTDEPRVAEIHERPANELSVTKDFLERCSDKTCPNHNPHKLEKPIGSKE
jgi:hypothetical protein